MLTTSQSASAPTPTTTNSVTNYDGSLTANPRKLVYPETAEEIQAVLRDPATYPGPVRAKGSYHSLTPCVSSPGTIVDMTRMTKIANIDKANNVFTAEGGLQIIEASKALRQQDMQFMTNIEIGNMTLGAAACCHSKDALDGIQFGQFSSYLKAVKWVTPSGDLAAASEADNPDLLKRVRCSHGLCGIVYEVTFQIKPVEVLHFTYEPHSIDELTQAQVDSILDNSEGLICWTVNRTCIFQRRQRVQDPAIFGSILALARRSLWNYGAAHIGHFIDEFLTNQALRDSVQNLEFDAAEFLYKTLHLFGGITILAPDKIIDYSSTPNSAKYAFTFWAFPRSQWLDNLRAYLDFSDQHFKATGFRCNMPLGSYHIRQDTNSLLSYTADQEIFSIDPIHASTDNKAWDYFLQQFNDFAFQRHGKPLLNQSPFVQRKHVEAAYGQQWSDFVQWAKSTDPKRRMLNDFFAGLLA